MVEAQRRWVSRTTVGRRRKVSRAHEGNVRGGGGVDDGRKVGLRFHRSPPPPLL